MEILFVTAGLFGIVSALAAQARGRSPGAWFLIGAIGQIFGFVAVLVMENLKNVPQIGGPRPLAWRDEDRT